MSAPFLRRPSSGGGSSSITRSTGRSGIKGNAILACTQRLVPSISEHHVLFHILFYFFEVRFSFRQTTASMPFRPRCRTKGKTWFSVANCVFDFIPMVLVARPDRGPATASRAAGPNSVVGRSPFSQSTGREGLDVNERRNDNARSHAPSGRGN